MTEVLSTFRLRRGDAAPDFSLPDGMGRVFSKDEIVGKAGLLVVFACNHCPFVTHLAKALGDVARQIRRKGVETVAINPNDATTHPEDASVLMPEFAASYGWDFPYLVDATQETAIAYGAACTPDFFLFGAEGRLFYTGQFDHSRPRSGVEAHGGDVLEAVERMISAGAPLPRPYPSSGCNIKWLAGKQPDWWDRGR